MADKFRVSQRVRAIAKQGEFYDGYDHINGTIGVIAQQRTRHKCRFGPRGGPYFSQMSFSYIVKFANGDELSILQRHLRPVYDGDQRSTWAEFQRLCGWAPRKEVANGR